MIFPYFAVRPHLIRPIIPLIIKSPAKVALYSALIDSGADYCIFGLDVAEALDIKLNSKNKVEITGIGRDKVEGFRSELELRIGNHIYTTSVVFAKTRKLDYGILGQKGFFDHFDVKLSYQKQAIEIDLIKPFN